MNALIVTPQKITHTLYVQYAEFVIVKIVGKNSFQMNVQDVCHLFLNKNIYVCFVFGE